jgi:TPR repeat protein
MLLQTLSRIVLLLALLVLAPAAHAQADAVQTEQANPILVPGAPWHFDGFVVNVPDDPDWASFSKSATGAELGKKFADGRTSAILVESTRFDDNVVREEDLLRVARRMHSLPPEPQAMQLTSYAQEAVTPKGVLCAHSIARFEDRRAQYAEPGTLVVRALSCIRPDKLETLVSLRFAERFAGAQAPALTDAAERFLASLRFVAPAGAMISQARSAIANKHAQEALDALQPAADQGDLEAMLFLGSMYLYGTGVDKDPQAALRYYEAAAGYGHRDALFNLGGIYDKAIGVARDPSAAIGWFTRAADQRDPVAQVNLAIFYLKGDGVPQDQPLAEQWLRRAAGNGSARAKNMLLLLQDAKR